MLFDIPFLSDWKKIGEHRQQLTDSNTARENDDRIDYDYLYGTMVSFAKQNPGIKKSPG